MDAYAADPAKVRALSQSRPKRSGVWEADVFESSVRVRDEEGEYQPLMTMIVDSATGFVYSARMFGRAYAALDALGDDLLDVAAKNGVLPERLEVKDAATAQALAGLARALGVAVEGERPLNRLYAARRALGGAPTRARAGRSARRPS